MSVMNVIGRSLMGLGLLLMLIGTASVPSTSFAAVVVAKQCAASCDHCGEAEEQGFGKYLCFRTVGGKHVQGDCDKNGADCGLCAGGCEQIFIKKKPACTCLKTAAATVDADLAVGP